MTVQLCVVPVHQMMVSTMVSSFSPSNLTQSSPTSVKSFLPKKFGLKTNFKQLKFLLGFNNSVNLSRLFSEFGFKNQSKK